MQGEERKKLLQECVAGKAPPPPRMSLSFLSCAYFSVTLPFLEFQGISGNPVPFSSTLNKTLVQNHGALVLEGICD